MIFQGTIKSKVMKQINARIDRAEAEFQNECKEIDKVAKENKAKAADKQVEMILGKKI